MFRSNRLTTGQLMLVLAANTLQGKGCSQKLVQLAGGLSMCSTGVRSGVSVRLAGMYSHLWWPKRFRLAAFARVFSSVYALSRHLLRSA